MEFSYRLAVITHGDSRTLPKTLASFRENVSPQPTDAFVYYDGVISDFQKTAHTGVYVYGGDGQEGFCVATRKLWNIVAAGSGPPYVFWLEHDFIFTEIVDVSALAHVLARNPHLAQIALMRDAVNEREIAAGGLFESRPGEYARRAESVVVAPEKPVIPIRWLEHQSYFTTNPSLMSREFMRDHPFPVYAEECEGRYGLELRRDGFSFGAMDWGKPWVEHIGARDGFGY